ncbi:MAG: hypothetical protein R3C68_18790 [Myxococcota bacterium]
MPGLFQHSRNAHTNLETDVWRLLPSEDLHGTCEVLLFAAVFAECEDILRGDEPILVRGRVQTEGDESGRLKLRASSVERLADVRAKRTTCVEMQIPVFELNEANLIKLKEILSESRGLFQRD